MCTFPLQPYNQGGNMEVVGAIFMAAFGAVGMYIYMRVRELRK